MKRDYLSLAPAPIEEWNAQAGLCDYPVRAAIECFVFRRMLLRLSPVPVGAAAELIVKVGSHDAGEYREVGVQFDNEEGEAYALRLEGELPELWDNLARAELDWLSLRRAYEHALASRSFGPCDVIFSHDQADPPADVEAIMRVIALVLEIPMERRDRQAQLPLEAPVRIASLLRAFIHPQTRCIGDVNETAPRQDLLVAAEEAKGNERQHSLI